MLQSHSLQVIPSEASVKQFQQGGPPSTYLQKLVASNLRMASRRRVISSAARGILFLRLIKAVREAAKAAHMLVYARPKPAVTDETVGCTASRLLSATSSCSERRRAGDSEVAVVLREGRQMTR